MRQSLSNFVNQSLGRKIKTQFQRYDSKMKSILINLESADYIELSASEKSDVYVKITKKVLIL